MTEAIQLVTDLNEEFYEITNQTEWTPFAFDTDGTEWRITFLGFPVFSTAADIVDMDETLRNNIMVQVMLMINDLHQFDKQRKK
jgi:hypothetical protein